MTEPPPIRRWDPLRPLDLMSAVWSTAVAVPPVSTGAAAAHRTVFFTLRRMVVGRRITVRAAGSPVTMTVSEVGSRLDVRRLSVGQLDDVRVVARDITWQASRFDRASAVLHNVHVRPGTSPMLVAAPVELTLDVPTEALDDLVSTMVPLLAGTVGDDGVARLRFARRPGLGQMEIDAELDGSAVALRARSVTIGRRRWPLPASTPAYRMALPELPHGVRLTGVHFEPGLMRLSGLLQQWRMGFTPRHLEYLLGF
ncbi:LmeA family phospholipid-binding protein [Mycolicibacterium tokaiense]|uniref:Conserved exported protein of uncharacterized function n=1 Tax=Mycolicibacterium tokaiense TaxID=39695 RepID=A0A378TQG5_9MYCO|nr:LmeA family phospholipid-binding protein [Mycolicibacterium tokaiense]BBY89155.1 hypothetical protein MTOK_49370 [Mycolicibacterium tokaiense]STZ62457.1 Conserved exported protein of uncharacterised function [Mycolicibacterium tokaiense]